MSFDPQSTEANVLAFPNASKQEHLLHNVLDNLPQAVLMFNSHARLIYCNKRYLELYDLPQHVARPGAHLRDLLEFQIKQGSFVETPKDYMFRLMRGMSGGRIFQDTIVLPDQRAFLITNRPLAGGGWVAMHEDIKERRSIDEKIVHMARHDSLTDLPNRRLFRERLEHELKRVGRGECLALLCLDLDQFKSVNDALGHPVGDELLRLVSDRLRRCVRDVDTVARLGGDEFAIIMTRMEQHSDAETLSKRVRDSISQPYQIDGHQIVTDISIGISVAPFDDTEADALLKNADMALYGAKADGRGTYRFFEPEMNAKMKARRQLELDLRKALLKQEFELHYQPLVNLENRSVNAFEALVRWRHPDRGLVPPSDFIPLAEETGLILPLGEWVLRTACAEAVNWPDHIRIAVNLSPAQLNNRNLLSVVGKALEDSGLPATRLQLEITETVLLQNTFSTLETLHAIQKLGIQIALDDFGTGYSSLSYLRSFPFDKIKIDRSFITDINNGTGPIAIVNAITGLAKSLNMVSTAEGVETEQQLEAVKSIGCTEMQGYLFSRALPASEIRQFFGG